MISVLILTFNEEINLPRCLDALAWCDDIVVLDSGSTDQTVSIAKARGARVYTRIFDNENAQRTYSLELPYRYEWVFNPDADEVATEELTREMLHAVREAPPEISVFRIRRKDIFLGRWIKHSSLYPTWLVRLFRPDKITFERLINLTITTTGRQAMLREHLIHYSFNKGISPWIEKHNRYSTSEAAESVKTVQSLRPFMSSLLSADAVVRRKSLKELSTRVPCRPLLRFVYMYVFRLGILDGRPGLIYCGLVAFYELMIVVKVLELHRRLNGDPV
jgi:glycosyltransferase involved in cell wall biosynthesis